MVMRHDHWIEWVWLLLTLVDITASTSSWRAAKRDWSRAKNEKDRLIQKKAFEEALIRESKWAVTRAISISGLGNVVVALMLLSAAIIAIFLPPPPPVYTLIRQSLWIVLFLIAVTIGNTSLAIFGRMVRYRLSTGFYEREARHRAGGKSTGQAMVEAFRPGSAIVSDIVTDEPDAPKQGRRTTDAVEKPTANATATALAPVLVVGDPETAKTIAEGLTKNIDNAIKSNKPDGKPPDKPPAPFENDGGTEPTN
jgi:hypothetical protein